MRAPHAGDTHRGVGVVASRALRHAHEGRSPSRQQRLRIERKAERVPVWDEGAPDPRTGTRKGPNPLRARWRLVHPDPYGGHGSSTAASVCGCQCRECRETASRASRTRYRAARPAERSRARPPTLTRAAA